MELYRFLEDLVGLKVGVDVSFRDKALYGYLKEIVYLNGSIWGIVVGPWGLVQVNAIQKINEFQPKNTYFEEREEEEC